MQLIMPPIPRYKNTRTRRRKFLLGLLLVAGWCSGQTGYEYGRAWLIGFNAGYGLPAGDWQENYNDLMVVGPRVGVKTVQNWIITLEGGFGFGGLSPNARAVIAPALTQRNQVINERGTPAEIGVYQRYATGLLSLQKIFPFWQANKNSGPIAGLGAGMVWHWLALQNTTNDIPHLNAPYSKGYDQMRQGLLLRQSLGYHYMSPNRRVNFSLSLEASQLMTSSVRKYHYATGTRAPREELSLLYALKLSWYIPIYRGAQTQEYYE